MLLSLSENSFISDLLQDISLRDCLKLWGQRGGVVFNPGTGCPNSHTLYVSSEGVRSSTGGLVHELAAILSVYEWQQERTFPRAWDPLPLTRLPAILRQPLPARPYSPSKPGLLSMKYKTPFFNTCGSRKASDSWKIGISSFLAIRPSAHVPPGAVLSNGKRWDIPSLFLDSQSCLAGKTFPLLLLQSPYKMYIFRTSFDIEIMISETCFQRIQ